MKEGIFRRCRKCKTVTEHLLIGRTWRLTLHKNFLDGIVSNRYLRLQCINCGALTREVEEGSPALSLREKLVSTPFKKALHGG